MSPVTDVSPQATWSQRLVQRTSGILAGPAPNDRVSTGDVQILPAKGTPRRGFLQRAALVGTALAVNPFDFILRPGTAYAQVCGPSNECNQGWSAFCCTINGGANTCPPGSYTAGWWKVSSSAFCRGEDRYVVDCNRLPSARCSCRCADGACDRRRVCCNNFRYGQCNTQIAGTTEVVCRIVICTPPWIWGNCTTTVRTDERTREHTSSCLNGKNPTEIAVVYQDLGLVGSSLGRPVEAETGGPDDGSYRRYDQGLIVRSTEFGITVLLGPAGIRYGELGGPNSPLGYITDQPTDIAGGQIIPAQNGSLYLTPDQQVFEIHGPIDTDYNGRGGVEGWLGFPTSGMQDAPGGRLRVDFAVGWSLVFDPSTAEVRLLPGDVELSSQPGEFPPTAGVTRWDGDNRITTAIRISRESLPDGASTAVIAASDAFADALSGGVLAGIRTAPVLLTATERLVTETADELRRLGVTSVTLVGGPSVLSPQVEADLAALLPDVGVTRLAGDSRFATAVEVSRSLTAAATSEGRVVDTVYLTSGRTFPDALAASPAAAGEGVPLLLCEPTELPIVTRDELLRLAPSDVVIVGGEVAVSAAVAAEVSRVSGATVTRLQGQSRYDTAAAVVARTTAGTSSALLIATGEDFADALAAGAASAVTGAPLMLTAPASTPRITRDVIERLRPTLLILIGGTKAVSDVVLQQLGAIPTGDHLVRGGEGTAPTEPGPDPDTSEPNPAESPAPSSG